MGGSEWKTVAELQAANVLLVEDGNHGEYRPLRHEFVEDGVAFVRAADLTDGVVDFASCEHINSVAFARIRKGIGRPSDVLLSHKGTVGKLARTPEDAPPFVCSPQTTFWRVLDPGRLRRDYLYAFLRSPLFSAQLAAVQGETDMAPYVSLTAQRQLKIALPSLTQQEGIGKLLGALDDKIELNRRMAETLEAMARALFKSWFVDFDPVRAKAEGRATGLPDDVAAMFPGAFTDNGLPQHWGRSPLADNFNVVMGQSPPGSTYNSDGMGLPFYQGRTDFSFRFPVRRMYCSAPTRRAQPGDTLVSVRAPVGAINMANEECCIGRGVAAVRHKSGSSSFTYYAVHDLQPRIAAYESEGTVFGAINKTQIEALEVLEPPLAVPHAFDGKYALD